MGAIQVFFFFFMKICFSSVRFMREEAFGLLCFGLLFQVLFDFVLFFSRFMNQYFLLIACLQLWSLITPVNPASTWGPLIFIFAVSATKEAWDDYNRYLSDKKANQKQVWVVRQGIKKHVSKLFVHILTSFYSLPLTYYIYFNLWTYSIVDSSSGHPCREYSVAS